MNEAYNDCHETSVNDDATVPNVPAFVSSPSETPRTFIKSNPLVIFKSPENFDQLAVMISAGIAEDNIEQVIKWMRWFFEDWTIREIAIALNKLVISDEQLDARLIFGVTEDWKPAHIAELTIMLFNKRLLPNNAPARRRDPRVLLQQWDEAILQEIVIYSKVAISHMSS